jgi:hypothetical protein
LTEKIFRERIPFIITPPKTHRNKFSEESKDLFNDVHKTLEIKSKKTSEDARSPMIVNQ